MVFSIKFMTSSDILYILRQCIIQLCWTISYTISLSIHAIVRSFRIVFTRWACVGQCTVALQCLWFTSGFLSVPQRRVRSLLTSYKFLPSFMLLVFSTISKHVMGLCSCLERFFWWALSWSIWSFFCHQFRYVCFLQDWLIVCVYGISTFVI